MRRLHPNTIKRLLFWGAPAIVLAAALVYAFRAEPELVDIAVVTRGPLLVTVDDEGETRVHDVFTVSAPIAGRLQRTPLHVGDAVEAGKTVVARIEPVDPALLDPRARAEAEAGVRTAEAAARYARAERGRAVAEQEFATSDVCACANYATRALCRNRRSTMANAGCGRPPRRLKQATRQSRCAITNSREPALR